MGAEKAKMIKLHGRRKGRPLRAGLQTLVEELLPKISVEIPKPDEFLDLEALFATSVVGEGEAPSEYWYEIGFGGGEHLAWQAKAHPQAGIIGAEIFINGIATLLRSVHQDKLGNVRILQNDARELLFRIPDDSLSRAFLLFPDPWPKNRHANRRFVQKETLDELARVLKDGSEFRLGTDNMIYLRWSLRLIMDHPDFEWLAEGPNDWRYRPEDWPQTRYEAKQLAGVPKFLRFRRLPRS
ncbi:tRNA (guanosine(46)-N7)-methyltransferase TrmB [Rhodovibrionaceae bacterium A322]